MKNLPFNDGYESFTINDDPMRIIRFNPADPEIISQVLNMQKHLKNYKPPAEVGPDPDGGPKGDLEKSGAYIGESTAEMREVFSDVFLSDVHDTVLANQSSLYIIGQKYLYEEALDSLLVLMKPAVETYNRKNREEMNKYLKDIKQWLAYYPPALV